MRVTVVVEQLRRRVPGGIGTYIRGLVQGLAAMGDAAPGMTLWASRPARGDRDPDPVAALGPATTSSLPAKALGLAWSAGWDGPGRPTDADAVHATSFATPPRGKAPMSVMVHDLAWRHRPDAYTPRGRRWHEAALDRARRRAALLMAPSQATADDLATAGVDPSLVAVVEEGSDHLPPPDHDGATALLDRLDLGRAGCSPQFLLSVSTLEPRKNLHRLVEAYESSDLDRELTLLVVGPPGWDGAASAFPTPRSGAVVAAGAVSDGVLAALYERARAVAYVPLVEGFGLPVLEAMRAGTPVVATAVPSAGDAALTVQATDVDSIAHGLQRIAADEVLRARLVEAGRHRAGELTWERAARRHVELWTHLVADRPAVKP